MASTARIEITRLKTLCEAAHIKEPGNLMMSILLRGVKAAEKLGAVSMDVAAEPLSLLLDYMD